jgi:hypothetical protein
MYYEKYTLLLRDFHTVCASFICLTWIVTFLLSCLCNAVSDGIAKERGISMKNANTTETSRLKRQRQMSFKRRKRGIEHDALKTGHLTGNIDKTRCEC